jgi:hypothetical protein
MFICFTKWSSAINSVYPEQELFSYITVVKSFRKWPQVPGGKIVLGQIKVKWGPKTFYLQFVSPDNQPTNQPTYLVEQIVIHWKEKLDFSFVNFVETSFMLHYTNFIKEVVKNFMTVK